MYAIYGVGNPASVGAATAGAGVWGQLDLVGERIPDNDLSSGVVGWRL